MSNQIESFSIKRLIVVIVVLIVLLVLGILFYYIKPLSQESAQKPENDSLETIGEDLQGLEQDLDSFDQSLESDFQEVDGLLGQLEK